MEHPALLAIDQCLLAHAAGVDAADGLQEFVDANVPGALVGAEDAVVLAGEGIAVGVLEQARRAHDDGRIAEVVEHVLETLFHVLGEGAHEHALARLGGAVEELLRVLLLLAQQPDVVLHQVGVEVLGGDVERVVGLQHGSPARALVVEDPPGQEHAHGLAADETRGQDALADAQDVLEGQVAIRELG